MNVSLSDTCVESKIDLSCVSASEGADLRGRLNVNH